MRPRPEEANESIERRPEEANDSIGRPRDAKIASVI